MTGFPEPFDLSEDEFLEGEEGRLDIDDIFAKDLSQLLEDFSRYAPEDIIADDGDASYPSLFEPGYTFRDVPAGVLLICPRGDIAGGSLSCDLVVDEPHRGKGLGMELVIERCLRDGMNPVLNLDESAYSNAGLECHRSAWRHARSNPDETRRRMRRWRGDPR